MATPTLLAYTITSSLDDRPPMLRIGAGRDETWLKPDNPLGDSFWIVIINSKNPREKVKEWVTQKNSVVPAGIDTYMNDPDYIYAVATQSLLTFNVPQGDFYDFLVKYGAGRELQKLEQLNATLGYSLYGYVSYVLTSQCGPRVHGQPSPPSYEVGGYTNYPALLMMSLESLPNGGPPYGIVDSYTFPVR